MQQPNALPYAFTVSVALAELTDIGSNGLATPAAVVIQETAFPGWQVRVNGSPAELTPVGGYVGTLLAPGDPTQPVVVTFAYVPRWFYAGAIVTLLTAIIAGVYLVVNPRWLKV